MDDHMVLAYQGKSWRFRTRWVCTCGDLMPEVPFGILLERAFSEHVKQKGTAS